MLCEIKFYNDVFYLDESYAQKLRTKESEYKRRTKTKKAVYTIMLSTYGTTGTHSIGLVSKSLKMNILFD